MHVSVFFFTDPYQKNYFRLWKEVLLCFYFRYAQEKVACGDATALLGHQKYFAAEKLFGSANCDTDPIFIRNVAAAQQNATDPKYTETHTDLAAVSH